VDNAKYFASTMFKDFYQQVEMKVTFASVYHPQSNGAVERVNALVFKAINKILEGKKKCKCAKVMPRAVWSHNTTVCRATNFTPFWMMYGAEAVLPEEVKHWSLWTATEAPVYPSKTEKKDLLEPNMLKVVANLQKYQEETKTWRDPKVKLWELEVGNLVVLWSPRSENTGKMEARWAKPYVVIEKMRLDTYRLSDP
jgi:hypothetical protein